MTFLDHSLSAGAAWRDPPSWPFGEGRGHSGRDVGADGSDTSGSEQRNCGGAGGEGGDPSLSALGESYDGNGQGAV
eukprot:7478157-Alexandrium_andersonii.AAC.1